MSQGRVPKEILLSRLQAKRAAEAAAGAPADPRPGHAVARILALACRRVNAMLFSRTMTLALTMLACASVWVACVLVSCKLAESRGLEASRDSAAEMSVSVLTSVERIAGQVDGVFEDMATMGADLPRCGDADMALMHRSQVRSAYIGAVARVSEADGRMQCSTMGAAARGFDLGMADFVNPGGITWYQHVRPPWLSNADFIVMVRDDVAVFVLNDVVTSILATSADTALGAFSRSGGPMVFHRGRFDPEWARSLLRSGMNSSFDGAVLVAISPSKHTDYVSFVAFPAERVDAAVRNEQRVMVPLGVFIGTVSAICLFLFLQRMTSMAAALCRALPTERVFMHYQPIVDLRTLRCIGAEALMRWQRNEQFIPPDRFIVAAERAGVINRVTRRAISLVARDASELLRLYPDFHISINLSAQDLCVGHAVELLQDLLRVTGLPASNFWVEATETGVLEASEAAKVIAQIRGMGIRVAVDDFGTGYSSLAILDNIRPDMLKIDKQFVATIVDGCAGREVVMAIIALGKSLGLDMVAEGVETQEQADFLLANGVRYAQGWLFGKPGPISALKPMSL
ncbi:EAL domain-containing protein [Variovorax ginsengisoli]|uniref:Sensor c-di-GMP phosphodiesterase-like protein n=1 Tax=Variovorax ginsengisoli TaxID=363844 RepID=A0ABT9SEX2_9BURK|nr:EAL domain-containing protein [Variovorax ginsengisoli]MDP9902328.1 sensor c-di-GMP phosphodiesterase-like protein [Variovorax ginsengisoli]